jgi:hypothetical protein
VAPNGIDRRRFLADELLNRVARDLSSFTRDDARKDPRSAEQLRAELRVAMAGRKGEDGRRPRRHKAREQKVKA